MNAVHAALPPTRNKFLDIVPDTGVKLTPKHYAYLKISEGCNHRCSFCIIPSMRGNLVSRPVDEVLLEAEKLVKGGVKELLVISQDTSAYGVDVKYAEREWRGKSYRTRMTELCEGSVRTGRVGAPALRLPVPARGRDDAADGSGQDPAVPGHSRSSTPARASSS